MKTLLRGLFFLWCLLCGTTLAARPLGRLFFSDAERAALDRPPPPPTAQESPAVTSRQPLRFDGLLQIGTRPVRWFINGEALTANELRDRGLPAPLAVPSHGLPMRGADGRPTTLRAGQTADVDADGHVHDITPDTMVRRRPVP